MYRDRRSKLSQAVKAPILLASGGLASRNYAANQYPFRASSHFLYFVGWSEPDVAALIDGDRCTLYYDTPSVEDQVWNGPAPDLDELRQRYELDAVEPMSALKVAPETTFLPVVEAGAQARLRQRTGRDFEPEGRDSTLIDAIIELRLRHDADAVHELRQVCQVTALAHKRAMEATRPGLYEYEVLAELQKVVISHGMSTSFGPIVSRRGEVLHNPHSRGQLEDGDLLLVDFGAEAATGWAGDVTRTYPVNGRFTPLQKDLYQSVLSAELAAIDQCRPGVSFRDVHLKAATTLAGCLVDIGLLKGSAESLTERGTVALFFNHGIGHLLGLDVHDMEDFGDRAGYAPGRTRSSQFGLSYLRLDRDLEPGMAVTIEPGFYWNPALLEDQQRLEPHRDALNMERIREARVVRGIRIEDDVLVTAGAPEVLTPGAPKSVADLEETLTGR